MDVILEAVGREHPHCAVVGHIGLQPGGEDLHAIPHLREIHQRVRNPTTA